MGCRADGRHRLPGTSHVIVGEFNRSSAFNVNHSTCMSFRFGRAKAAKQARQTHAGPAYQGPIVTRQGPQRRARRPFQPDEHGHELRHDDGLWTPCTNVAFISASPLDGIERSARECTRPPVALPPAGRAPAGVPSRHPLTIAGPRALLFDRRSVRYAAGCLASGEPLVHLATPGRSLMRRYDRARVRAGALLGRMLHCAERVLHARSLLRQWRADLDGDSGNWTHPTAAILPARCARCGGRHLVGGCDATLRAPDHEPRSWGCPEYRRFLHEYCSLSAACVCLECCRFLHEGTFVECELTLLSHDFVQVADYAANRRSTARSLLASYLATLCHGSFGSKCRVVASY